MSKIQKDWKNRLCELITLQCTTILVELNWHLSQDDTMNQFSLPTPKLVSINSSMYLHWRNLIFKADGLSFIKFTGEPHIAEGLHSESLRWTGSRQLDLCKVKCRSLLSSSGHQSRKWPVTFLLNCESLKHTQCLQLFAFTSHQTFVIEVNLFGVTNNLFHNGSLVLL